MICAPCAAAADNRLARDFHCDDPACACGHRVEQYQPLPPIEVRILTPPIPVVACEAGEHCAHPGLTCTEYVADRDAMRAAWDRLLAPVDAAIRDIGRLSQP